MLIVDYEQAPCGRWHCYVRSESSHTLLAACAGHAEEADAEAHSRAAREAPVPFGERVLGVVLSVLCPEDTCPRCKGRGYVGATYQGDAEVGGEPCPECEGCGEVIIDIDQYGGEE